MSTEDMRLHVDHIAVSMFSDRVARDLLKGQAEVFQQNPDARILYFKGVQDTLDAIETWVTDKVDPNTMGFLIEKLQEQTKS